MPSPQQDISRTHVELKPEGDHVVVTDLRSTNGTVVTLPGAEARRLHPAEAIPVGAGAVIDLGDGVTAEVHNDQDGGGESEPVPRAGTGEPAPGQTPAAPAAPYGRPAPYRQPNPYGPTGAQAQPGHYGQPPAPGSSSQPGPYGPPPQGPGVPPPPDRYGSAGGAGPVVDPYGPYQGGAR
ncbi:FHA domain-containing protein [Sanguibacter sp. Z1732]|uniref:FHA domain-containing protein n=1 Tax=Sanguibacter sp. Z1732 TaxID=3435412 RepID=UPI003D9C86D6